MIFKLDYQNKKISENEFNM